MRIQIINETNNINENLSVKEETCCLRKTRLPVQAQLPGTTLVLHWEAFFVSPSMFQPTVRKEKQLGIELDPCQTKKR